MKAIDICEHFVAQADWVDPEKTVDRVVIGDPGTDVRRVLVTWIASFQAVRAAVERGVDMLVTHEPTFYVHANELKRMERSEATERKRAFIERSELVILRIHDVWDRFPRVGVPWAWARFLGLGDEPVAFGRDNYQHRYDIEPRTLEQFAHEAASRAAAIGERCVQVVGDGTQRVSKVGVGTGCACDIATFQQMGCDVSIVCDDGSCYWSNIQRAADMGHPVVRVNHGTSEEPGMVTLTEHINAHLPGVTAEHLPHGSTFRLVSGGK